MVSEPENGLRLAFPKKEKATSFIQGGDFTVLGHKYTPAPCWIVVKAARLTNIPLGTVWKDIMAACKEHFNPIKVNYTQPGGIFMDDALVTYNEADEERVPDYITIDGHKVPVHRREYKPKAPVPPKTSNRGWEKVPSNQRANTSINVAPSTKTREERGLRTLQQDYSHGNNASSSRGPEDKQPQPSNPITKGKRKNKQEPTNIEVSVTVKDSRASSIPLAAANSGAKRVDEDMEEEPALTIADEVMEESNVAHSLTESANIAPEEAAEVPASENSEETREQIRILESLRKFAKEPVDLLQGINFSHEAPSSNAAIQGSEKEPHG